MLFKFDDELRGSNDVVGKVGLSIRAPISDTPIRTLKKVVGIGSLSISYEEVALNKLLEGVTEDEIAVVHTVGEIKMVTIKLIGWEIVNTHINNVHVVFSKGVFRKDKFKATDNKVEINLDAAKELAEKKEFRRAKKELDRRMEEQFTKIGALTASMHRQLDHVMTSPLAQMGTNGSLDGQGPIRS
ncbi:hypothetical protein Tco_0120962 [Tanacetum coccineum]